jgi:hypothetical protein
MPSTGLTPPCGGVDRFSGDVRTSDTTRAPSSPFSEARLVKVVGYPVPAIPTDSQQRCRTAWSPEQDASSQSLQPTCCHEYPRKRPIPKHQALALPTAVSFPAYWNEWGLVLHDVSRFVGAVEPLLVLSALGGQAVGAAAASCYRIATPTGSEGVPSSESRGHCQPSTIRATRIADAPCRLPHTLSASRDDPRVPGPASPHSTKSVVPQTRGAFHQQVPPPPPALTVWRPHGPPLVPWLVTNDPVSDMRSRPNPRSARLNYLPAIRRGRRATCRLSASATDCPLSTPPYRLTSAGSAANHLPIR